MNVCHLFIVGPSLTLGWVSVLQVSAATSHNTDGHFRSETGHLRRRQ